MKKYTKQNKTERYISEMETAIIRHFAPGNRYHGKDGALTLASDIGTGLADSPEDEVESVISSLYSRLLARNTFGHKGGVPIDNKVFVNRIRKSISETRALQDKL